MLFCKSVVLGLDCVWVLTGGFQLLQEKACSLSVLAPTPSCINVHTGVHAPTVGQVNRW